MKNNPDLVLVSAFITNPEKLKHLERQWAKRDKQHKKYFGRTQKQTDKLNPKEFGGSILLINPYNLQEGILKNFPCSLATGMIYDKKDQTLLVGSGYEIVKIFGGKIKGKIKNNLFNDLHSMDRYRDQLLLISSTGTDSLIEYDLRTGKKTWDWLASENGFDYSPTGEKVLIDREKNYNGCPTSTPKHSTHINGAIYFSKKKILATLFHQGQLILIDKKTKRHKVVLSGLKCPHHIRKTHSGYVISDTRNDQVLIMDKKFKVKKSIKNGFNWLQDSIELRNGSLLVIDSNNYRICRVLVSNGQIVDQLDFSKNPVKLYGFLKIVPDDAETIFKFRSGPANEQE